MFNYQPNNNDNQTPYAKRSMYSEFDHRQSEITAGAGRSRGYRETPFGSRGRGRVRSRGRGRGRLGCGYGYVGIRRNPTQSYTKESEINPSSPPTQFQAPRQNSTQQKYRLKETIKDEIKPNMVEIQSNGSVQQYVDYALDLFSKQNRIIHIIATGRAISKAINCVEIIKRKRYGLYQESIIEQNMISEIWEPLEKCLNNVIVERELIYVRVTLTYNKQNINKNNIGYQEPVSWIDLGDAREMHDAMKGKMGKLQNKFDAQSKNLTDSRAANDQLQIDFDLKADQFTDMKHKYDEQEVMMNQQMTDLSDMTAKFTELKGKYDEQNYDHQSRNNTKYNKQNYDVLQAKFDELKKHNDDREEKLRIKKNKFAGLNATQSVDIIININQEKYLIYKDILLKNFIDQGIDGSCLNQLTKQDLLAFGITNYKDRIKIFKAIKTFFI